MFRVLIPHDLLRTESVCYQKVFPSMTYLCAQAQLGSIVTVPWVPVNIRSLEELMESDLTLKAHWKIMGFLRKSSDDRVIGEIIARLEPVEMVTELVEQLQRQRKRDFAYLMYRRNLQFYASQSVSFKRDLCTGCLEIPTQMILAKKLRAEHRDCFSPYEDFN